MDVEHFRQNFKSLLGFKSLNEAGRRRYKELIEKHTNEEFIRWRDHCANEQCAQGKFNNRQTVTALCKDLGADVKEAEEDNILFQEFLNKKYDDVDPRRFFLRYYKSLIMAVPGEQLFNKPTENNAKNFVDAITHTEKGQWSSKQIYVNALTKMNVHPEFIDICENVLTATNDKEFWSRAQHVCVVTNKRFKLGLTKHRDNKTWCCPITASAVTGARVYQSFLKFIEDVYEKNIPANVFQCGDISTKKAINFIITQSKQVSASRIVALLTCGFNHIEELKLVVKQHEESKAHWKAIAAAIPESTFEKLSVFSDLAELTDSPMLKNFSNFSADELCAMIMQCSAKRDAYRIIIYHLKDNQELWNELEEIVPAQYRDKTIAELFQKTPWRKELFNNIMEPHQMRVKSTSNDGSMRFKEISYMAVKHLEYMDKYAIEHFCDKIPSGMDPLRWLFGAATKGMITDIIIDFAKSYKPSNHLVKSNQNIHHAKYVVAMFVRLVKTDLKNYILATDSLQSLTTQSILSGGSIENLRVPFEGKRCYSQDEIDRMLEVSKTIQPYNLMITILYQVGLRVGCISQIKYRQMVDEHNHPRHTVRVREKFRDIREFETSLSLKQALVSYIRYIETDHPHINLEEFYMFNIVNPYQRLHTESIRSRLKQIGEKAQVSVTVHPHVFRHTTVGILFNCGNNLKDISVMMGHKDVSTTATHYLLKEDVQRANKVKRPWDPNYTPDPEEVEQQQIDLDEAYTKIDDLLNIISKIQATVGEQCNQDKSAIDVRKAICDHIPNLQERLNIVAASIHGKYSSSTSSYSVGSIGII